MSGIDEEKLSIKLKKIFVGCIGSVVFIKIFLLV